MWVDGGEVSGGTGGLAVDGVALAVSLLSASMARAKRRRRVSLRQLG